MNDQIELLLGDMSGLAVEVKLTAVIFSFHEYYLSIINRSSDF